MITPSLAPVKPPPGAADPLGDVARAWGVWKRHPGLPLGTALVATATALSTADGTVGGVGGLVALLLVGWVGTERLWYLRAWHGLSLRPSELLPVTLRYFWRFFLLGLLFSVAYVVICLPPIVAVVSRAMDVVQEAGGATPDFDGADLMPTWALVWLMLTVLLLDMVGTFVTPALVYSTWRVSEALRLGVRLLRQSWPHAALYVVVPPLALVLLNSVAQPALALAVVTVIAAALLNLLVKGAVAAYYLRIVPIAGPDGARRPTPVRHYSSDWSDHR